MRTSLTDRPGALAAIAAGCGESGLNILALQIFPEVGRVVDELVVESGEGWTHEQVGEVVASAGGAGVRVVACGSRDLVDEPIRWLRAAERLVRRPYERDRILERLIGPGVGNGLEQGLGGEDHGSFAEHARVAALLDVARAAGVVGADEHDGTGDTRSVAYEVTAESVVARVGDQIVGTATWNPPDLALAVSPPWRRRGIGRATFVMMAGVARHLGADEVLLSTPSGDLDDLDSEAGATMAMLDSLGLRGRIRLKGDLLLIRIGLGDIRPVVPRVASG